MKLSELSPNDRYTLEFAAREYDGIHKPLADPPTPGQLLNLRFNGYVIGPEGQVYRTCTPGVLRECYQGLPCSWYCGGVADGKCTEVPTPNCNVPDGCHHGPKYKYCHEVCPIVSDCQFKCAVKTAQWSVDGLFDQNTTLFSIPKIDLMHIPRAWKQGVWIDHTPPAEVRFFHTHTGTAQELLDLVAKAKCVLVFKLTSTEGKLLAQWTLAVATAKLTCEMYAGIQLRGNFYVPWLIRYNREIYEEFR